MSTGQEIRAYTVLVTRNGVECKAGGVSKKADGWRFVPNFQAAPSRKGWPTPEAALKGRVSNYRLAEILTVGTRGPVETEVRRG